ncbi:MAG: PQQ-dependent sugar dehydrogenase [Thermoleophilaceae bacterium]
MRKAGKVLIAAGLLTLAVAAPASAYTVPPDNPFVSTPGAKPEIWAFGLRNPWRFSFDRLTGDLVVGDVGQNDYEEIDFAARGTGAGANYGWNKCEGKHKYPVDGSACSFGTLPQLEYGHVSGRCSVTGGYVFRDPAVTDLYGRYIYGDYCTGETWSVALPGSTATPTGLPATASLTTFGQDADGHLYIGYGVGSTSGNVQRIVQGGSGPALSPVGTFGYPTYVTSPPGDASRLFVVERQGTIHVVDHGVKQATPFLDISGQVQKSDPEQGLLSMAFSPDYGTSGRFFVYYTNSLGDVTIEEFKVSSNPDVADPSSGQIVLTQEHRTYHNHNGGQLQFGPDGYLYAGIGDGGSGGDPGNNAQDIRKNLLGKIIRIDVGVGAGPGAGGAAQDKTPPTAHLYYRKRQRLLRTHLVTVAARFSEDSAVTSSARVSLSRASKSRALRLRTVARTVKTGVRTRLRMKASRRTLATVRGALAAHRRVTVRVTVTARDARGNRSTVRRTIRVIR